MKLIEGVIDFGDAIEIQLDRACGIYKLSNHTIAIELYANRIVDGKVQRVIVLRCRWDRTSWLADQEMMAKLVMEVLASPSPAATDEVASVH
jgi:hypothetical protein